MSSAGKPGNILHRYRNYRTAIAYSHQCLVTGLPGSETDPSAGRAFSSPFEKMITTPLRPIPESYWVIPGRFLAGEYPGSWDQERTTQRMDRFLDAGFNTFIDLTAEGELLPYGPILAERAACYNLSASHQRFSIGDFGIPSVDQMKMTLDTLDMALQESRKVYVHCWGGVGRTGTTVGCYLVRHGKTGAEAL